MDMANFFNVMLILIVIYWSNLHTKKTKVLLKTIKTIILKFFINQN